MIRLYAAATAALLLSACGHAPRVQGLELRVREVPGGYLTGEVSGLERVALLDNKEFVYSIAFSPGAEGVAFSRILGKKFQLALWSLPSPPSLPGNGSGGVPQAIAEVPVNEYAFDVEAVAYSPDGKWVVTAGRDGAVRAFRSADGQRTAESVIGEPLVSIAFVPGDLLAVGSARGLVTLLTWPDLRLAAQKRVHSDEVRALVALPQKRLISGSWDKTIAVLAVEKERLDSGEAGMQPDAEPLREVKRHHFDSYVNDLTADRAGRRLGVAFSAAKAERNRAVYDREKRGQDAPFDLRDMAAIVDVESGAIVRRWTRHLGPVSSVAISPDGRAVASGGWDKRLYVFREGSDREVVAERFGWILRRVRFSPDGRLLAVAAWTPPNAVGNQESDPSAVVYEVLYSRASVARP